MTRAAIARTASRVRPGDWVAEPGGCTLSFAVRNFGWRTVTGHIPLTSAVVHVGPGGYPVSARAELDAAGIDTGHLMTGPAGLVGRFCSLPFRQLAGPAAVLFWWPARPSRLRERTPA